jgi:acyl-CoA hydrolase
VAVGGIQFVQPILIGDLVTVRCKLIRTGTSSMHIAVDVVASDLKNQDERRATSCVIVFVALDSENGRPTPVPPWKPTSEEDSRLAHYAERLVELSRGMEQEIAEFKPIIPPPPG